MMVTGKGAEWTSSKMYPLPGAGNTAGQLWPGDVEFDPSRHYTEPMDPPSINCNVELLLLGCRNLQVCHESYPCSIAQIDACAMNMTSCTVACDRIQPVNLVQPTHPKIILSLPGKGVNTEVETSASSTPSGKSPNFQCKVVLGPVDLPIDPLYAPAITVRVVEERFFSKPVRKSPTRRYSWLRTECV
eukprot:SAG31_NODE_94_length_26208_cov_6.281091_6_plen_188_part_00